MIKKKKKNYKRRCFFWFGNKFVVFYAGKIDILRGIDTPIKALPLLIDKIPNIKLVLGGKIVKPYDPFKTARILNVEEYLEFVGWIDEKKLPSYIAASNVCFFTPPPNRDEINKTIATKIYQYALMGKPIIVSEAQMMKEFIENNKLGISIHSEDSFSFARAVMQINKGDLIFNNKMSFLFWEETIKPLYDNYRNLNKQD